MEDPSICRSTYAVGFAVGRPYWSQGICTEALKQTVRFGFDELKVHKIVGDNDSDNPASGRVFEKAGFEKEGIFKEHVFKRGRYIDRIRWGLINPVDLWKGKWSEAHCLRTDKEESNGNFDRMEI